MKTQRVATPHRVRVHAHAVVLDNGPLLDEYPGADLVVEATVTEPFINCPRYITRQASSEPAIHVPDENGQAPLADWKRIDLLQGALPTRFQNLAETERGTLTVDEYAAKILGGD